MRDIPCKQLWRAEAKEDGRLSGADAASFERHCETCASCAHEAAALGRLRAALTRLPEASISPLERRRLRGALLKDADAVRLREPHGLARRYALLLAAAILLLFVVAFAVRQRVPEPLAVVPPPRVDVVPSADARWQIEDRGPAARHRLEGGRVAFHVERLEAGQRFVLDLPDGELEVKGTRFVVDVGPQGTNEVSCSEGRVVLRLADQAEVSLVAGETWRSSPKSVAAPPPDVTPPIASAPRIPKPASTAQPGIGAPGADFVEAMTAFSEADFRHAEQLFRLFVERHPGDARVEDAMFLRAVARERQGDRDGARELARNYLDRYPNGLRKSEAEQLAR